MRIIRTLLTACLIAWALVALALRLATPLLADYRLELAATLGERLGAPVGIGSLRARWYGLGPVVELGDVAIGEPGARLELRTVVLDLDHRVLLGGSLFGALRASIDGLQLTLVREEGGQFQLEGIGPFSAEGDALAVLPAHLRLLDTRLVWIDRAAGRAPVVLDDIDLLFDRSGERLALRGALRTAAGRAELAARLDRLPVGTGWSGETYLRLDGLDVAALFRPYLPQAYDLAALDLDLEVWSQWREAVPTRSQGRLRLRDLALGPAGAAEHLRLEELSTRFSVRRDGQELALGLRDLQIDFGDHRWPVGDLAFALERAEAGARLRLAADYLRVDDLVRVLEVRWPWPQLAGPLRQLDPRGELHDLRLALDTTGERPSWRAQARVLDLSTEPWDRVPAVRGLSATLHAQQGRAVLEFDSRDVELRFDGLFRDPLELSLLSGRVDLEYADTGWRVSSQRLAVDTPHIRTVSRVRLEQAADSPLFLDLQTDFGDGDAAFASRYYPVGIMAPALVRWLDRSILSGRVRSGSALLYGPLQDFAFGRSRNGMFEVLFDTEDVVLDYREGWPRIDELAARVRFHGNQLEIEADSGRIHDSRIVAARARIDSLRPTGPLQVRGELRGPLQDKLRVLNEGALRERFGDLASIVRGSGDSLLGLDFTVPLAGRGAYALDGVLRLDAASLVLPQWDLSLEQIRGELRFDLDGLRVEGAQARLLGTPVTLDVAPRGDGVTGVSASGLFAVDTMAQRLPLLAGLPLSGQARLDISLDVPPAAVRRTRPGMLQLASDLQGAALDLPEPLGKPAEVARALRIAIPLGREPASAELLYGDNLGARFSTDGGRVAVRLGGGQAADPAAGIRVDGRLERLDALAWGRALDGLPLAIAGADSAGSPVTLDLALGELLIGDLALAELQLRATRRDGEWRGSAQGEDLAGRFQVPAEIDARPVVLDLERLWLRRPDAAADTRPATAPTAASAGAAAPAAPTDPARLPGLALQVADLRLDQASLGRLELDLQPRQDGIALSRLQLQGGQVEVEASGHWLGGDAAAETRVEGSMQTRRLGDLLVALGYARQLEEAEARCDFSLQWPSGLTRIEAAAVQGRLGLDIGAGRLVELDPGVTRVVGLLNLNALTRRLRLDFSDFYKKGYSFDSIRGDLVFADGLASTDNLRLLGPTGRIELRGSADLRAHTLDQHVRVTPDLDATLPLAGALAGGPVAGIAVLLAQKLMEDEVDRLNRFEYRLSGPWTDPEVTRLDSGGALSRILRPAEAEGEGEGEGEAPTPAEPAQPTTLPEADRPQPGSGDEARGRNPLRGVLRLLEKGEPHHGELPGSGN